MSHKEKQFNLCPRKSDHGQQVSFSVESRGFIHKTAFTKTFIFIKTVSVFFYVDRCSFTCQ